MICSFQEFVCFEAKLADTLSAGFLTPRPPLPYTAHTLHNTHCTSAEIYFGKTFTEMDKPSLQSKLANEQPYYSW